jgi:hypothetical protein
MQHTASSVDPAFDELGYGYANDNGSPISKLILGCRELWAAVLEKAFRDRDLDGYMCSRDFKVVCEYAGVEPEVMRLAAEKIVSGKMQLAPKFQRQMRGIRGCGCD